jgi:phosphotriesterase-related protein
MGLIDAGYLDQILIGQDVCFKDCLTVFGGFGYAHIVRNVPRLMRAKGLSEVQIDRILVQNPSRFLRFR